MVGEASAPVRLVAEGQDDLLVDLHDALVQHVRDLDLQVENARARLAEA